jgi:hypothetical protein
MKAQNFFHQAGNEFSKLIINGRKGKHSSEGKSDCKERLQDNLNQDSLYNAMNTVF